MIKKQDFKVLLRNIYYIQKLLQDKTHIHVYILYIVYKYLFAKIGLP